MEHPKSHQKTPQSNLKNTKITPNNKIVCGEQRHMEVREFAKLSNSTIEMVRPNLQRTATQSFGALNIESGKTPKEID